MSKINYIFFENKAIKSIDSRLLGYDGENKQQILKFSFDNFIDGTANLEFLLPDGQKGFIELEKDIDNQIYSLEVKSSLLSNVGDVKMQISLVKEEVEIYKTEIFEMYISESINATERIEEQYPTFVEVTESRLVELENNKQDKLIAGNNVEIKEDNTINVNVEIPKKISEFENDRGYITQNQVPVEVVISSTTPSGSFKLFIDESEEEPEYAEKEYVDEELNKKANITDIPDVSNFITNTVNNLVNYYKKSETYTQEEINQKLSAIPKFDIKPVDELPSRNISNTTVYLLKTSDVSGNLYTEYIYVNNIWEKLGTQSVDLTGYATEEWVNIKLNDYTKTINLPTKLSDFTDDLGNSPIHTHNQYLTSHQDISGKEDVLNKVTSISSESTDTQYPTAKCVYDLVGDIEELLREV